MTSFHWMLLLLTLSAGHGIEASEWIVRPIDDCGLGGNVEVMVDAYDGVVVGYTQAVATRFGDVGIARINATEKLFSRNKDAGGGSKASFAMDDYANVFWSASTSMVSSLRVGQDMGVWDGIISSEYPFQSQVSSTTSMAVNPDGLPTMAGIDADGYCFLSRFNPITAAWEFKKLGGSIYDAPFAVSLSYDSAGNAVLAYLQMSTNKLTVLRENISGGVLLGQESANMYAGRSLSAGPDGMIGLAYVDMDDRVVYGNTTSDGFAVEEISPYSGKISSRSLAYSPINGQPSLVYSGTSSQAGFEPLYLATRDVDGTWTNEQLPVSAHSAGLAFDSSGNVVIAALTDENVVLIGQNIPVLIRGDFDLDDEVTAGDVAGFVQAVVHPQKYLQAHPDASAYDLLLLGDFIEDGVVDIHDARQFLDSLATDPVAGLPTRSSGYTAFDQADQDPLLGSGNGNFFSTMLASPKPYALGDARGDLGQADPGSSDTPDGMIDAVDIDYLFAHLDGSDPRADLNQDSTYSNADIVELVSVILGVPFGDANLDGIVNGDDAAALASNWLSTSEVGWSDGDFNGDGRINEVDATIMAANWQQNVGTNASVPEPGTAVLLLSVLGGLLLRNKSRTERR